MVPGDLLHVYALARETMRLRPDALGSRQGHRLFWGQANQPQLAGRAILATHPAWDAATIVGSHGQCGVVLVDRAASLRHLLLRSIALPYGGVALRVLDLHTEMGFMLTDGSFQTSILAEGPVAIAVGETALVALPSNTPPSDVPDARAPKDDRFPTHLPPPEVSLSSEVREQLAAMDQALSPYRVNARPRGWSRITLMPRLVMMGEPRVMRMDPLAPRERWSITLERDGRSATETVSEADLDGGVLIGRSEKCLSEELRRITNNSTSRAHVLLLREVEQICAYDLASTHGLYQNGAPVRRVVLGSSATLTLGHGAQSVRVLWGRATSRP